MALRNVKNKIKLKNEIKMNIRFEKAFENYCGRRIHMHVEENGKEKKVDYIELFFDLIFVYTFRTVNALITHGDHFPSVKDFALFSIWYW